MEIPRMHFTFFIKFIDSNLQLTKIKQGIWRTQCQLYLHLSQYLLNLIMFQSKFHKLIITIYVIYIFIQKKNQSIQNNQTLRINGMIFFILQFYCNS
ncbi:unnamed protein product [Paramecium pentaurelia]|uniref:Uncharacterized protein n=1 Tax=Paramecium pentaurelia TaxID=43138 RepID=A0A8S1TL95_9CILI|nr:unnamed protein product [Paramecium pentaurelia]